MQTLGTAVVVALAVALLVIAVLLVRSRNPHPWPAIVAAMRREGGMRVETRGAGGRRIVDRFSLDGAPLAIDAAAACAATLANR